jgi:hypothetical protein
LFDFIRNLRVFYGVIEISKKNFRFEF